MSSITDEWLKLFDTIDDSANELMHQINQHNQYPTDTKAYIKNHSYIKDQFKKFQRKVIQLQDTLNQLFNLNKITQRERERRQRLVDNMNDRCTKIASLLENPVNNKKTTLLNYQKQNNNNYDQNDSTLVSWNEILNDDSGQSTDTLEENDKNLYVTKYREEQKKLLNDQELGLDALSTIIIKQKLIAHGIDQELGVQNEIIEDIGQAMDDNTERLLRNNRNLGYVNRKTNTCGYWIVIIILLIAIIIVSLIPI